MPWDPEMHDYARFGVFCWVVNSVVGPSQKGKRKIICMQTHAKKHNSHSPRLGEIIESSGGPCHLSIILLKNFNLFKIAESVINFCLKNFSN